MALIWRKNYLQKMTKMLRENLLTEEQRTANSTYPKVAVQWSNQALCFYQSLCLVDSEVLRNRHLRVAANRYGQAK